MLKILHYFKNIGYSLKWMLFEKRRDFGVFLNSVFGSVLGLSLYFKYQKKHNRDERGKDCVAKFLQEEESCAHFYA